MELIVLKGDEVGLANGCCELGQYSQQDSHELFQPFDTNFSLLTLYNQLFIVLKTYHPNSELFYSYQPFYNINLSITLFQLPIIQRAISDTKNHHQHSFKPQQSNLSTYMSTIHKRTTPLKAVTSRTQLPPNEWSHHHLLTLRKSIDHGSHSNTQVREQLKIQRQNSHQFLSHIRTSMLTTEQSGIDLIAKYEQQMCKYQQLTQLVKHYQHKIELQKQQEHHKILTNTQANHYDQLNIELTQKQKLLETVTNKLNSFQSETMSSYELVKAERRQRTVFSNQFNKFQNELFCLEEKYKQFVIERTLLQQKFDLHKSEFIKLQNDTLKHLELKENKEKSLSKAKYQQENNPTESKDPHSKQSCQQSRFQIKMSKMSHQDPNMMFSEDSYEPNSSSYKREQGLDLGLEPSWLRSRSRLMKTDKYEATSRQFMSELNQRRLANLDYKKKIQTIINDFGMIGVKELRTVTGSVHYCGEEYMQSITNSNEERRQEISSLQDQISDWQERVTQLRFTIRQDPLKPRRSKSIKLLLNRLKSIKGLMDTTISDINSIQEQILDFNSSSNLHALTDGLEIQWRRDELQDEGDLLGVNSKLLSRIGQRLFNLMGTGKWSEAKSRYNLTNHRKSFIFESILTHSPQKQNTIQTQRSICPLLSPSRVRNSKRVKTSVCRPSELQPIKKLSNLLRNQSRFKGPVDVASKEQMINEATEAFGKEGIFRQNKFYVNYSSSS